MTQEQILKELARIPEAKLAELYDIIHYFRLGLEQEQKQGNPTMELAGSWADMPEELFQSLIGEIASRRKQAFSKRRIREFDTVGVNR
jgi:hypothetical protein